MKRAFWITLLAVVAFLAIVLARLPANWVLPSPPGNVSCAAVDGTLWNGMCAGLIVQGRPVGDVTWELHPRRLLGGKLAAHVVVTRPDGSLHADIEAAWNKSVTARNLVADLPLDPAVIPKSPPNLRGSIHADLALARFEKGAISQLQGRIEAHDLQDSGGGHATRLGSYSLTFPGGSGEPAGQLRDLGDGPVAIEGTLRLTREPGFELESLIKLLPGAPGELADNIQILGSPDAQGRRPFSMSGTF